MQCRKCGTKKTTRRRAGVFSCGHCGVQPGPSNMDRAGIPRPVIVVPQVEPTGDHIIRPRQSRLRAGVSAS